MAPVHGLAKLAGHRLPANSTSGRARGGAQAMNFDFSDDLKELREQARKFLRERCSCAVVRRVLEGPEAYDKGLWSEIAAMGWTGAAIPEAYGGVGLGHLGLCVLTEEENGTGANADPSSSASTHNPR